MPARTLFEAKLAGVRGGRSGFLDVNVMRLAYGFEGNLPMENVHAHIDQFPGVREFHNGDMLRFEVEENPRSPGRLRAVRGLLLPRFEGVLSNVSPDGAYAVILRADAQLAPLQEASYAGNVPRELLPQDDVFVHIRNFIAKVDELRDGMRTNFLLDRVRQGRQRGRVNAVDVYVL